MFRCELKVAEIARAKSFDTCCCPSADRLREQVARAKRRRNVLLPVLGFKRSSRISSHAQFRPAILRPRANCLAPAADGNTGCIAAHLPLEYFLLHNKIFEVRRSPGWKV